MKRSLMVFLILCLAFSLLSPAAFAAGSSYKLDELGMSIELPQDYIVFTRDIKSNDPNLSAYGLTRDELYSLMVDGCIYLNAWDKDLNYEIIVTMTDSPIEDFNLLSDTSLRVLVSAFEEEYKNFGISYIKSDIYQHSQAKFAKIYISQQSNNSTVYGLEYSTAYNGQAINITLQSYTGEIDSAREATLKKIVDSVCFDTAPQRIDPPAQTAAFTYTDQTSGLCFTVPENWVEAFMYQEREYLDTKFTSNLEEGMSILFGCEDLYESEEFRAEWSKSELRPLTRAAVNNDLFTKTDVVETFGCEKNDVSIVSVGGKEYYRVDTVMSGNVYGLRASSPVVCYLRCENGFLYLFLFSGSGESPYFQDFESLLSSAVYPEFDDTGAESRSVLIALLWTLFIAVIYSVPIIIYRYAVKRQPIEKKKAKIISLLYGIIAALAVLALLAFRTGWILATFLLLWSWVNYRILTGSLGKGVPAGGPTIESSAWGQMNTLAYPLSAMEEMPTYGENDSISFCHHCGSKLVSGSKFCRKCGTKIPVLEKKDQQERSKNNEF